MNFSTWISPHAQPGSTGTRAMRWASLSVLALSLTGCPLEDNPDGGPPPVGDMGVACTAEYAPVCGVDGVTYGNACEANARGVLVSHYGECDDVPLVRCGGIYGDSCGPNEYCDYSGSAADLIAFPLDGGGAPPPASGVCRPRDVQYCVDDSGCASDHYCNLGTTVGPDGDVPFFIPPPYDQGVIFVDAGAPHDAGPYQPDFGVMPPPRGTCEPREVRYCFSVDDPACHEGEYCDLSGLGIDFAPPEPGIPGDPARPIIAPPGVCRPEIDPPTCTETALVCGSNGITYQNACVAESMGATVVSEGRCPPSGQRLCGGWVGDTCAADEYCRFEPATFCDYADASGYCTARPQACTREYSPVCGCNGVTYSNACSAAAGGTSVAVYGACDTDPVPGGVGASCGGRAGQGCASGLFCQYPADALCGAADAPGACARAPEVCTDIWAPVCGCDGRIYGNECDAAASSVSVGPRANCLMP